MTKRDRVFFDLQLGGKAIPRVTFQLYTDIVPKTARNFKELCTKQKPNGFKNSSFHRIISNFMAQGGDFTKGNGTGGTSIYGAKFADENFTVKHTKPYMLSMANAGPNTNGSQFFITFIPCDWLDGKHVVFGQVIDGKGSIDMIHKNAASKQGEPRMPVTIVNCGVLE